MRQRGGARGRPGRGIRVELSEKFLLALLVVLQIICGIVLEPGVAGAAFPSLFAFVFAPPMMAALNGIAWWAVMLFVWAACLELDLAAA